MADKELIENITVLSSLILKIGVPAVQTMVVELGSNPHPTPADIDALADRMKPGKDYFPDLPDKPNVGGETPGPDSED